MVQGDTSSALAIATVAFHKKLRIAHVEAGILIYLTLKLPCGPMAPTTF